MENNYTTFEQPQRPTLAGNDFYTNTIKGLKSKFKFLDSKYFYDEYGDKIFQDIMNCPDYYPTACEMEIFTNQSRELGDRIIAAGDDFDLIELGAGDATKSIHILKYLMEKGTAFTYFPIDISLNIISYLNMSLMACLPGIKVEGLHGEYFKMLKKANEISAKRKVVLFLGSTIGNMNLQDAAAFCTELRQHLHSGDMVLIGADLEKAPKTILAAYNDSDGLTRKFNLNLLERINRELDGDFDVCQFEHFPTYDPETGECKSFLVSLNDQVVRIGDELIGFKKDESIKMEISQKFTLDGLEQLASASGFRILENFHDQKQWFVDTLWLAD